MKLAANASILWVFPSIFFVPKTVSRISMGQTVILYNTLMY